MFKNYINKNELIKNLQDLIKIPSVHEESQNSNAPFGENTLRALNHVLNLGQKLGFKTKNIDGYCGYIEKHGLRKGATYGINSRIQLTEPLSVNPSIFTMGIGLYIDIVDMGYIMNSTPSLKSINFGAADKNMSVKFDAAIPEEVPAVSVGSRNITEIHGQTHQTAAMHFASRQQKL